MRPRLMEDSKRKFRQDQICATVAAAAAATSPKDLHPSAVVKSEHIEHYKYLCLSPQIADGGGSQAAHRYCHTHTHTSSESSLHTSIFPYASISFFQHHPSITLPYPFLSALVIPYREQDTTEYRAGPPNRRAKSQQEPTLVSGPRSSHTT